MNTMSILNFFGKPKPDRTAGTLRTAQEARMKVESAASQLKSEIRSLDNRAQLTISSFITETRELRRD